MDFQYLYKEADSLVCMNTETFDQVYVPENLFGESAKFLKEGINVKISFDKDIPIYAEPPLHVILEVTYTEPGMKGDTATKTLKPATLETGAVITVPLFIEIGEKIKVDAREGVYVERVK
jgi:elongation factor P